MHFTYFLNTAAKYAGLQKPHRSATSATLSRGSSWLFATYGGWRNYNVAVLDPCTGYPLNFETMKAAGRHRTLASGETLQTGMRFLVQEGLHSVGSIDASGKMSEAS